MGGGVRAQNGGGVGMGKGGVREGCGGKDRDMDRDRDTYKDTDRDRNTDSDRNMDSDRDRDTTQGHNTGTVTGMEDQVRPLRRCLCGVSPKSPEDSLTNSP